MPRKFVYDSKKVDFVTSIEIVTDHISKGADAIAEAANRPEFDLTDILVKVNQLEKDLIVLTKIADVLYGETGKPENPLNRFRHQYEFDDGAYQYETHIEPKDIIQCWDYSHPGNPLSEADEKSVLDGKLGYLDLCDDDAFDEEIIEFHRAKAEREWFDAQ